ncbi:MAG: hypothetical protein QMD09_14040, partial [Desulfatibacillaceae bacterium]|nr:hypothetical protein [Desulfatibacillaceae bacterium]
AAMPDSDGRILVRYLGRPRPGNGATDKDYVILFGNIRLDDAEADDADHRMGAAANKLAKKVAMSFAALAHVRVLNILFALPVWSAKHKEHIERDLASLFGFMAARNSNQQAGDFHIVLDETRRPDANLSLLAAANSLKPQIADELVKKIRTVMLSAKPGDPIEQFPGIYEAIFGFKKLREQLVHPVIEMDNPRWLIMEQHTKTLDPLMARLVRLALYEFGQKPHRAARMLSCLLADDYGKVDAPALEERLYLITDLISAVNRAMPSANNLRQSALDLIFNNLKSRLDLVNDDTYDNLMVKGCFVSALGGGLKDSVQQCDQALVELVEFYQQRSVTREKIKSMLNNPISFDEDDYSAVARDFSISNQDARQLVSLLQSCFDAQGRFVRRAFEKNIPAFAAHERKVFEFLWHFLKDLVNRQDRIALLNALQLLIDRIQQPFGAILVLFEDFVHDPLAVTFTDRNALMLITLLLRKYNKELHNDIEVTPEEVLLVWEGLNPQAVEYAKGLIERERLVFLQKVRTIHHMLKDALDPKAGAAAMPVRYIITLEREIYILLSLLGGETACSILKSALGEYSDPASEVYSLKHSSQNLSTLLQICQVVVRGLSRASDPQDLSLLKALADREQAFMDLSNDSRHADQVRRLVKWADSARESIRRLSMDKDEDSFQF